MFVKCSMWIVELSWMAYSYIFTSRDFQKALDYSLTTAHLTVGVSTAVSSQQHAVVSREPERITEVLTKLLSEISTQENN